jgi:hypothetical protein
MRRSPKSKLPAPRSVLQSAQVSESVLRLVQSEKAAE